MLRTAQKLKTCSRRGTDKIYNEIKTMTTDMRRFYTQVQ